MEKYLLLKEAASIPGRGSVWIEADRSEVTGRGNCSGFGKRPSTVLGRFRVQGRQGWSNAEAQ